MTDENQKEIWFPAKRYGYGWGFPVKPQGWVFFIAWLGIFFAGTTVSQVQGREPLVFWLFILAMVVVLLAVCYLKGEKPRWRWGD